VCNYGVVITDETKQTDLGEKQKREAIHILFPIDRLDSLRVSEIIIFDLRSQKSYASLAAKTNGIFEQNTFYFDLMLALLQINVYFLIKKSMRELQFLEISKVVFFNGLTKDILFKLLMQFIIQLKLLE
jgi:hypothetical protein